MKMLPIFILFFPLISFLVIFILRGCARRLATVLFWMGLIYAAVVTWCWSIYDTTILLEEAWSANVLGVSFVMKIDLSSIMGIWICIIAQILAVANQRNDDQSSPNMQMAGMTLITWLAVLLLSVQTYFGIFSLLCFIVIGGFLVMAIESKIQKSMIISWLVFNCSALLLMLAALIYLQSKNLTSDAGNLNVYNMKSIALMFSGFNSSASLVFWAMVIPLMALSGLFPFHGWLWDSLKKSSLSFSIIQAILLSRIGLLVLSKNVLPYFSSSVIYFKNIFIVFGVLGMMKGIWIVWRGQEIRCFPIGFTMFTSNLMMAILFVWSESSTIAFYYLIIGSGLVIGLLYNFCGGLGPQEACLAFESKRRNIVVAVMTLLFVLPIFPSPFHVGLSLTVSVLASEGRWLLGLVYFLTVIFSIVTIKKIDNLFTIKNEAQSFQEEGFCWRKFSVHTLLFVLGILVSIFSLPLLHHFKMEVAKWFL